MLLALAGATPDEIITDYLMTYPRMQPRYHEEGAYDVLGNGLTAGELDALRSRLTAA